MLEQLEQHIQADVESNGHREYPGAPDRGGSKEDTDNYVELVKTLRAKFDSSGKTLGITFTAPSSYWYLRWFDLPGMMKYCDWLNFVSLAEVGLVLPNRRD